MYSVTLNIGAPHINNIIAVFLTDAGGQVIYRWGAPNAPTLVQSQQVQGGSYNIIADFGGRTLGLGQIMINRDGQLLIQGNFVDFY